VQFDFNLPKRFEMEYVGSDGARHRPLMVHRALYGSIERFFGILVEHYAGHFPLWLAPTQAKIVTITDAEIPAAEELKKALESSGLRVEVDARPENHKIRDAAVEKVPYVVVLGARDVAAGTLSIRLRDERQPNGSLQVSGVRPEEFARRLVEEVAERRTKSSWENA
jgi:threonyl-tRNA synthetase